MSAWVGGWMDGWGEGGVRGRTALRWASVFNGLVCVLAHRGVQARASWAHDVDSLSCGHPSTGACPSPLLSPSPALKDKADRPETHPIVPMF